jgi:hypothetical protein
MSGPAHFNRVSVGIADSFSPGQSFLHATFEQSRFPVKSPSR